MNTKKVLKYAVSLLVAALLMYFSFRGVDWAGFARDLKLCRWGWIALAAASSVAAFYFRSQRWKCLLRPIDPTIDSLTTFNCVNIGYLANFVFPRIGEVVRCGFINSRSASRHKDDPQNIATFDKTLGTVLMSRSWDVAVVLLLFGVLLAARWERFGDFFIHRMWAPFTQKQDFNAWWLVAAGMVLLVALGAAAYLLRGRSKALGKVADLGKGILRGFASWARMRGKWLFFIWTLLLWGMYFLMSYAVIRAMPALDALAGVDALFISVAGSFAWMVPVPGGFGAYHYIVALALSSVYSLSWEAGIMCATLNHETQAITMVVCGLVSYIIETIRKK